MAVKRREFADFLQSYTDGYQVLRARIANLGDVALVTLGFVVVFGLLSLASTAIVIVMLAVRS